jgi:uncharacterized membrane protein YoaK (UPF0700 family)
MTGEHPPRRAQSALMVLLTGVAGWVDAVGFASPAHVFVANQTGNAVFLALHVVERLFPQWGSRATVAAGYSGPLTSIAGFCLGAAAAVLVAAVAVRWRHSGDRDGGGSANSDGDESGNGGSSASRRGHWPVLILEALFLAVAAIQATGHSRWLGLTAAAMGAQSVYAARVALRGVTTTTLTGTMVTLVAGLPRAVGDSRARRHVVLLTAVLAAYVGGAGCGASVALGWSFPAAHVLAALVVVAAALLVGASRLPERSAP